VERIRPWKSPRRSRGSSRVLFREKGAITIASTIIEKILSAHAGKNVKARDVVWIDIDVRSARDFGGASVVKNLKRHYKPPYVDDIEKTFFTFDCNVPARDTGYAENQQICRIFAREAGIRVFDVRAGIGSHVVIERGVARPGSIVVGTDSHLNILGAIGCFGQGMGDRDIAYVFASGRNWFEVPSTMRVVLEGGFDYPVTAKDVTLAVIRELGSAGALGKVIEFTGEGAESLSLSGKITLASMATEMGAVAAFLPVDARMSEWLKKRAGGVEIDFITADEGVGYTDTLTLDLSSVEPLAACPSSPSNVKPIAEIEGTRIDTAFLGSCTNGRFEDMVHAASILKGRRVKEGVSLKVVPATQEVYERMLAEGILQIFIEAGALVSNPGCSGCASGQIGMVGKGEIQLSTSNRNFAGKQGKGETYLVSPAVLAASVVKGGITSPLSLDPELLDFKPDEEHDAPPELSFISWRAKPEDGIAGKPELVAGALASGDGGCPSVIKGRARLITAPGGGLMDDIDTDMIFHNKYLSITDIDKMGEHTFETLEGYGKFASTVEKGDIIISGGNFGCGSSRQQAVDCFIPLGVSLIITESTGAIYKRNIINSGFPFLEVPDIKSAGIEEGELIEVDFENGTIKRENGDVMRAAPPTSVQLDICRAGGLFAYSGGDD
jgi:3-isopropylmalate dehydratase large subunit/3-isopropylmalate dehydratase small subunit